LPRNTLFFPCYFSFARRPLPPAALNLEFRFYEFGNYERGLDLESDKAPLRQLYGISGQGGPAPLLAGFAPFRARADSRTNVSSADSRFHAVLLYFFTCPHYQAKGGVN